MVLSSSKLLKIGGPVLTGIGGVIATSSLVSKSAEEKTEERLKTKSLNDEDPVIKEWKDRNESEEGKEGEGESGSSGAESSNTGEGQEGSKTGDTDSASGSDSKGDSDEDAKGEDGGPSTSSESTDEESSDGEGKSQEAGEEDGGKELGTENGSMEAENVNVHGNAYGTKDERMTQKDLEEVRNTYSFLSEIQKQLSSLS